MNIITLRNAILAYILCNYVLTVFFYQTLHCDRTQNVDVDEGRKFKFDILKRGLNEFFPMYIELSYKLVSASPPKQLNGF